MKRQLTRITAMILSLTIVLLSSTSAIAQTTTDPNLESAISLGIGTSPSGIINLSPLSNGSFFSYLYAVIGLSLTATTSIIAYSIGAPADATNEVICCAVERDYRQTPADAAQQYGFPTFEQWKSSPNVQSIVEDCDYPTYDAYCPAILSGAGL